MAVIEVEVRWGAELYEPHRSRRRPAVITELVRVTGLPWLDTRRYRWLT